MNFAIEKFREWYPMDQSLLFSVAIGISAGMGFHRFDAVVFRILHRNDSAASWQSRSQDLLKSIKMGDRLTVRCLAFHTILFAPVFEECVYRGAIYSLQKEETETFYQSRTEYLNDRIKNISFNSALFSLMHFDIKKGVKASMRSMPRLFFLGAILCGLNEMTGNLWAPTAAHGAYNAMSFRQIRNYAASLRK